MENDVKNLVTEFKTIANRKWIKSVNNSLGSIGLTFEKELGKGVDSLYFPDYYGVEIKCTSRFSRYPISLFTVAFDGPTFPEIYRIIDKYGWYDKDYSDKKVLFARLKYKKKTIVNDKFKFKLEFDDVKDKLYLCVYDLDNQLIEKESFIYTYSLYNHLCLKLKKLAVVHASTKKCEDGKYFRYYSIDIYKLISFDKFINLLENDKIRVDLIARIGKSGRDAGKYKNKSLLFSIDKDKIEYLFEKICSYNHDTKTFAQIME